MKNSLIIKLFKTAVSSFMGLMVVFCSFQSVNAASNEDISLKGFPQEAFVKGVLTNRSNFVFTLSPGNSTQNYVTIVNNSKTSSNKYLLHAVDSKVNLQQTIVLNSIESENPNFGNWIKFKSDNIEVKPESFQTIPFKINIPENAIPGSYYGGVSITKVKPENPDGKSKDSTMSVQVNTRYVLNLVIHVDGIVKTDYQVSDLNYNVKENAFSIAIENKGNSTLRFNGFLEHEINDYINEDQQNIEIKNLLIPAQEKANVYKPLSNKPAFGNVKSHLSGNVEYLDGANNKYIFLESFDKFAENNFFSWPIFIGSLGIVVLVIGLVSFFIFKKRKYLSQCVPYLVQENETLEMIAEKFNMPWKKLAKLNNIKAPFHLDINQQILIHENKKPVQK